MKRFVIYLVGFFAVLGLWSCSSDDLLNAEEVNVEEVTLTSAGESFEKAQNLFDSFRPKVTRNGELGQIDYPDYFGGCYIDNSSLKIRQA